MKIRLSPKLLAAVIAATAPASARATPAESSPFDIVTKISDWFVATTSRWNQFVSAQEREQLGRSLATACKALFEIRSRSLVLARTVPLLPPSNALRQRLSAEARALETAMAQVSNDISKIALEIDDLNPQAAIAISDTIAGNAISFASIDDEMRRAIWRPVVLQGALANDAKLLLLVHNAMAAFRSRLLGTR